MANGTIVLNEWSLPTYLSDTCKDGNPDIWRHFSQCVRTPRQLVGFIFGCITLFFWFAAHLVVIIRRHLDGFNRFHLIPGHYLLHESAADVLNCLGAVLSHQLGTQVLFGVYLLCIDAIFMIQFLILKTLTECTGRGVKSISKGQKQKKTKNHLNMVTWPLLIFAATSIGHNLPLGDNSAIPIPQSLPHSHVGRVLLSTDNDFHVDSTMKLGYVVGYLSILFHWTAAVPRAIKTDRQMSWNHFVCTSFGILGNLCYVISVFCHHSDVRFFVHTLPWTLGRLGMIGIDVGLVCISLFNRCRRKPNSDKYEKVKLLRGSDSSSESDPSEDSDVWMPLENLIKTKKMRKMKPAAKHNSDSDASLEEASAIKKSKSRGQSKFSSQPLAPPVCDGDSDAAATSPESEWRPAWTEDDIIIELTEDQVYEVLAEEDKKKEAYARKASIVDTHTDTDHSNDSKQEGPKQNGDAAQSEENSALFKKKGEQLVTVDNEEIVDLQKK